MATGDHGRKRWQQPGKLARRLAAAFIATLAAAAATNRTAADDPDRTIQTISVNRMELNHFYDDRGQHVLSQYIAWARHPADGQRHVMFWKLQQPAGQRWTWTRQTNQDWTTVLRWDDTGVLVRIRAEVLTETWTTHDPELLDRETLRKHERQQPPQLQRPTAAEKKLLENSN